ncbi:MAG: exosortase/archaeosortase family protein [Puniceicoccaceae bacterium]
METTATPPPFPSPSHSYPSYLRNAAVLLLLMAGYLVYDQWKWWSSREDYSFGFIVPLFVGYVVYERWPKIRAFLLRREWEGAEAPVVPVSEAPLTRFLTFGAWAVALCGLGLFFLGGFLQALANNPLLPGGQALAFGFAATALSLSFLAAGWAPTPPGTIVPARQRFFFAGLFVFPALIWILSLPLLNFAEQRVSLFLLNQVTVVVFNLFDILGIPLEQRGNVLILEKGRVGVEDACSGIRSLTASLFAGSFLAAVFLDRWWKKVLMIACAMILAFIMNIFRSIFLTAWAHMHGSDAIEGTVHDATGYAVLGFTCVGLLLLLPLFNFRLNLGASDEGDSDPAGDDRKADERPE